jgi:hypothetical protein
VIAERLGNAFAFGRLIDHARKVGEERVIFVESASILGDGIEQALERGPSLAVERMRMGRGNHIGACAVDLGVNGKGGTVDRVFSLDHFAAIVHQDQVRDADLAEVHPKRIDPEMIQTLGVARGNVSRHSFIETEAREEAPGAACDAGVLPPQSRKPEVEFPPVFELPSQSYGYSNIAPIAIRNQTARKRGMAIARKHRRKVIPDTAAMPCASRTILQRLNNSTDPAML